jgi:sugar phosphate isomerase/epimerase
MLFDIAAAFDAHHIKVGNIPGTPCELGKLTEAFAELCQDAANSTAATVVYEFMPFDVNVNSLETALTLVRDADQPNGGLAIDTWHMGKLGIEPDDLTAVPLRYLSWVELSDGQRQNMDDLVDETVNHRRLPGEGEFDIPAYVEACRSVGYQGPWGVEVLSEALRSLPIEEAFQRAYDTTAAQFGAGVA